MKKIFKNRYGLVRSGWIILICMFIFYFTQYVLSDLIVAVLKRILVMTGDINYATDYYSPLVDMFDNTILPAAFQLLLEIITIAVPVAAFKIMKYQWKDTGLRDFSGRFKKEGVVGLLLGFGGCTLIFLILLVTGSIHIDSVKFESPLLLIVWIFNFLLIGFAEEFFNRGLLMSVLRRTNNKYLVFALPSVIFGCIHLISPHVTLISIVNIIFVGLLFSYMYYKSGSIWMSIGFHITWNLFQSVVYGMPVSGLNVPGILVSHYPAANMLNGGNFGIEGGVLTTAITMLAFIFTVYYYRNSEFKFFPDPHICPQKDSE